MPTRSLTTLVVSPGIGEETFYDCTGLTRADDGAYPEAPLIQASDGWLYVRMLTEHQQHSANNQMDAIREYAERRGMQIVREYSDEGKSGLNNQNREFQTQLSELYFS